MDKWRVATVYPERAAVATTARWISVSPCCASISAACTCWLAASRVSASTPSCEERHARHFECDSDHRHRQDDDAQTASVEDESVANANPAADLRTNGHCSEEDQ